MGPPTDITPEALFRLFLTRPRPRLPLAFTFRDIEHPPLEVVALVSHLSAETSATDDACASLHCEGQRVFASSAALGALPSTEAAALVRCVVDALAIISPRYGYVDSAAWHARLCEGARHVSNLGALLSLGASYDSGWHTTPRPDRWFGCPLAELTDGQWMAYRAAKAVHEERSK